MANLFKQQQQERSRQPEQPKPAGGGNNLFEKLGKKKPATAETSTAEGRDVITLAQARERGLSPEQAAEQDIAGRGRALQPDEQIAVKNAWRTAMGAEGARPQQAVNPNAGMEEFDQAVIEGGAPGFDALPGTSLGAVKPVASGLAQAGLDVAGLGIRAVEYSPQIAAMDQFLGTDMAGEVGDVADATNRMGTLISKMRKESMAGEDTVLQNLGLDNAAEGTARSLTTMFMAGGAGRAAGLRGFGQSATVATSFGLVAADDALTRGRDAGMSEGEATAYATGQGAIEGGITMAFTAAGAAGLESFKPAMKEGIKQGFKQLGFQTLQEIPEELLVEAGQQIMDYGFDMADSPVMSQEDVLETIKQTVLSVGTSHGARSTARRSAVADTELGEQAKTARAELSELDRLEGLDNPSRKEKRQLKNLRKQRGDLQRQASFQTRGEAAGEQTAQQAPERVEQQPASTEDQAAAPDLTADDRANRITDPARLIGEMTMEQRLGNIDRQATDAASRVEDVDAQRRQVDQQAAEQTQQALQQPEGAEPRTVTEQGTVLSEQQAQEREEAGQAAAATPQQRALPAPDRPSRFRADEGGVADTAPAAPETPQQARQRRAELASPQAPEAERTTPEVTDAVTEEADDLIRRMRQKGELSPETEQEVKSLLNEARRNPLTGGMNRKAFEKVFNAVRTRAKKTRQPVSVVAFDAANLKSYNDLIGESAGDQYLQRVQNTIADALRDSSGGRVGDVFHYGGDEYAVVLPDTDVEGANRVRDRIEKAFGREEIVPGVSAFLVGDSTTLQPGSRKQWRTVLDEATTKMKTRKKEQKRSLGEAVDREDAEARAAGTTPTETPRRTTGRSRKIRAIEKRRRRQQAQLHKREDQRRAQLAAIEDQRVEQRRFVFKEEARKQARKAADAYAGKVDRPKRRARNITKLDERKAAGIARVYESLPHEPNDPEVQRSYDALKRETLSQFFTLQEQGYTFSLASPEEVGRKYPDTETLAESVGETKELVTADDPGDMPADHPMMEEAPGTGGWTHNQVFRAVHDMMGHVQSGVGFDIIGEENAWRHHSQMYSDVARGAMTTETRAQSNWVGYGPFREKNQKALANNDVPALQFPNQKATLLPKQYWTEAGLTPVADYPTTAEATKEAVAGEAPVTAMPPKEPWRVQQMIENLGVPMGTILQRYSPRMYGVLMAMDARVMRVTHDLNKRTKDGWRRVWELVPNTAEVREEIDFLWRESPDALNEYLQEVAPENAAEVMAIHEELSTMNVGTRENTIDSGVNTGYVQDHMPQYVKDYAGLIDHLFGEEPDGLAKTLAEARRKRGRELTDQERWDETNKWMAGHGVQKAGDTDARALGRRSIENLDRESFKRFYYGSEEAQYMYNEAMVKAGEKAKVFGKSKYDEDIEESIGRWVDEGAHGLSEQPAWVRRRLKELVKTRFTTGEQAPHGAIRGGKNLGYAATLGNIPAAMLQIADIALVMTRDGTIPALASVPRALREEVLTAENMGMQRISQEFVSHGTTEKIASVAFEISGFRKLDSMMKTVNMVSAERRAAKAARNPEGRAFRQIKKKWEPVLGTEQFNNLIEDLRKGRKSDAVLEYVVGELTRTQPLTLMDVPPAYAGNPNGRIFYMLKTFSIKQLDLLRDVAINDIVDGVKTRDIPKAAGGFKDLLRAAFILDQVYAGIDMLRNWVAGRQVSWADSSIEGLWGLGGLSTFFTRQAMRDGPGTAVWNYLGPPVRVVDALSRDATKVLSGEIGSPRDLRVWQQAPVIGPIIHYRWGAGADVTDRYAREDALHSAADAINHGDGVGAAAIVEAHNRNAENKITMSSVRRSAAARRKDD